MIFVFFCFFLLITTSTFAEDRLPEIVVNAPLYGLDAHNATRHIEIVYQEEILSNPVHSVAEILKYISSVDVMQRGPFGVQSDVGIRGGGFEHTLILLNGMRINDPQTGHHNLNIPLGLNDIERIEIIPSGMGLLYSAGSFGGVINIVTRSRSDKTFEGMFSLGSNSFIDANASIYAKKGDMSVNMSISGQKSDGYRLNTDFNIKSIQLNIDTKDVGLFSGYTDKRFGANGFYSLKYPLQWENTKTFFLSGRLKTRIEDIRFEPSILYRHGYDYYILDRTNPDFYKNTHNTQLVNIILPIQYEQNNQVMTGGLDLSFDDIDSTRLGKHNRNSQAFFVGLINKGKISTSTLDLRLDRFSKLDRIEVSPSLSLSYRLSDYMKLRAAFNRSFRLPSYTELYYTSPIHQGNDKLKPEISYNLEGGIDVSKDFLNTKFTIFKRWGRDVIDWIKKGDIWVSDNIDNLDTIGITISTFLYMKEGSSLKLDYTWLNQQNDTLSNAYGRYLRHKINSIFSYKLSNSINSNLVVSYQKRVSQSSYVLVDMKLIKKVDIDNIKVNLFVEGKNLLNKGYEDFTGLPMPGRSLFLGMNMAF
ncbi:MAG: TonB-dependent receptor [Thermodesulfovibrionales bacterium]|nr:TonB-dependent receptor [Thermodesulfovibrionales bacterium]